LNAAADPGWVDRLAINDRGRALPQFPPPLHVGLPKPYRFRRQELAGERQDDNRRSTQSGMVMGQTKSESVLRHHMSTFGHVPTGQCVQP